MRAGQIACVSLCALALASPAIASGGGDENVAKDLFYRVLNLALLVGVVVYFARKPIRDFFADRRTQVRDSLKSAAELRQRAEERYAQWQRRLSELEGEVASIRETARERAEREREQIVADARAAAERIKNDAHRAVDQELRRAKQRLRQEASELAVELAAEILREQVTPQDRERLFDEFIQRIEQAGPVGDRR